MKCAVNPNRGLMARVYDEVKYEAVSPMTWEVTYRPGRVQSFEVVTRTDDEIWNDGFDMVDPYQEYLVLTFADGEIGTFRNSYVDLFSL